MKKIFIIIISIVLFAFSVSAETLSASGDADGFTIYYKEASIVDFLGIDWSDAYCKTVSGDTFDISLVELGIQPGVNYVFMVRAFNSFSVSPDSNGVEWTQPAYIPPADNPPLGMIPIQPVSLTIKDKDGNIIAP